MYFIKRSSKQIIFRQYSSSVCKGTNYEILSKDVLQRYGFHFERRGGASDLGIDLLGFWQLQNREKTSDKLKGLALSDDSWPMINVIAQCKNEARNCKPSYVRELDGVISRWTEAKYKNFFVPPHLSHHSILHNNFLDLPIPLLGVLICSGGFTKSCIEALNHSKNPMMFITVEAMPDMEITKEGKDDIWYQCRLKFCKFNNAASSILPNFQIANTFSVNDNQPQLMMFYDDNEMCENELPQ